MEFIKKNRDIIMFVGLLVMAIMILGSMFTRDNDPASVSLEQDEGDTVEEEEQDEDDFIPTSVYDFEYETVSREVLDFEVEMDVHPDFEERVVITEGDGVLRFKFDAEIVIGSIEIIPEEEWTEDHEHSLRVLEEKDGHYIAWSMPSESPIFYVDSEEDEEVLSEIIFSVSQLDETARFE